MRVHYAIAATVPSAVTQDGDRGNDSSDERSYVGDVHPCEIETFVSLLHRDGSSKVKIALGKSNN